MSKYCDICNTKISFNFISWDNGSIPIKDICDICATEIEKYMESMRK